ncbi:tail fiber domain-containing protein [Hymenobacter sp. BRD67]|uniref:tail fiber domain-containing protein n=1 Tax=Hymenobacter sp. BRD67 TaxID=2675877 RepID=UPI001564191A|nr:tail fiber domain-containing protein [Hymenobacter sp. BRD67]QKG53001.1 tail fiber domain-containing protein [Hymenobacter sp. BRD67]
MGTGHGTTTPIAPLHVKGAATNSVANGSASFFSPGSGFNAIGNMSGNKSTTAYFEGGEVWVSGYIVAGTLNTTSDRRIKRVIGLSDRAADLALLQRLRITDYTYIDQVNNPPGIIKKVIAQEVEELLPTAVSRSTQALPNVYEKATKLSYADGQLTVTMARPHELPASGGRMRFYTPTNESLDPEVTVVDAHTVRFACADVHVAALFVYGKYVNDFRSVDYDALTTLNVSATQELARQVAALEAENTALKTQVATDKAQAAATMETFEARLRRLEAASGQAQR